VRLGVRFWNLLELMPVCQCSFCFAYLRKKKRKPFFFVMSMMIAMIAMMMMIVMMMMESGGNGVEMRVA